jgi:hypothetical protein
MYSRISWEGDLGPDADLCPAWPWPVGVAAFFGGFVSIIIYFIWWHVGKMISTVKYMKKAEIPRDCATRRKP